MQMMEELQYMKEKLPCLLVDLKTIQQNVDKRHKRSNVATVGGYATSIVGGAVIVGGIRSYYTFYIWCKHKIEHCRKCSY